MDSPIRPEPSGDIIRPHRPPEHMQIIELDPVRRFEPVDFLVQGDPVRVEERTLSKDDLALGDIVQGEDAGSA